MERERIRELSRRACALFLLMAGCLACTPQTPSSVIPTPSLIAVATSQRLTVTPSPNPSTATLMPIPPTSIPSPTASPTMTPPLPPTLTPDERERRVREMLKTNEGCKLPCWWGITPGKTTWTETERFFLYLGARITSSLNPNGTIFHGTGGFDFEKADLRNDFDFRERAGLVESIYIRAEGYNDALAFQKTWAQYSPRQVVNAYGSPSRVWLQTAKAYPERSAGETMGYLLWLFYDHLGILIRSMAAVKYEPIYHICPTVQNEKEGMITIAMFLQSPDNPTSLEVASGDEPSSEQKKYIRTIQEATGLSVEQFYQLFLQKDKPACFDTPRNIWP